MVIGFLRSFFNVAERDTQLKSPLSDICDEFRALAETSRDFKVSLKVLTARKPLVPGHLTAQSVTENGMAGEYTSGDDSTLGP